MWINSLPFIKDSDDEEHYEDLPAPDETDEGEKSSSESSDSEDDQKGNKQKIKSSWVHKNLKNSGKWTISNSLLSTYIY